MESKNTMSFENKARKTYQDMWNKRNGKTEKTISCKIIDVVQWILISVCIVAAMMTFLAEIGDKADPKIVFEMACGMLACSSVMLVLNKIQGWTEHYHEKHMEAINNMMDQLFEGYRGRLLSEKMTYIDAFGYAYSKGLRYRLTRIRIRFTWFLFQMAAVFMGVYFNFLNVANLGSKGLITCLFISLMLWGATNFFAPEIIEKNSFLYAVVVTYRKWVVEKEILQNNDDCLEEKESGE